MQRDFAAQDLPIHENVAPAEVRMEDPVSAELKVLQSNIEMTLKVRVWKVSPIGGEFLVTKQDEGFISAGDRVGLVLKLGRQVSTFAGLVVSAVKESRFGLIVGIRWFPIEDDIKQVRQETERRSLRWLTDEEFAPVAVAPNPVLFNDVIYFKVMDVSADGLCLKTSLRNKFIVPNMEFEGTLTFPMVGSAIVRFSIQWTKVRSESGRDFLMVGAKIREPSKILKEIFGQYIFQFGQVSSLEEIKKAGLSVRGTSSGLNFSWVKSKKEFDDILALRAKCYTWVTKGDLAKSSEMADEFDARCRILNVTFRGKTVGTLRVGFPQIGDSLEQQKYCSLPEDLPRNDQLVEVTRVCTDPEFRKSDLLFNMVKQVMVAAINAKRPWLLGSSPQNLLPLYKKMGAQLVGVSYARPDHQVESIEVLLFNISDVLKGVGINPVVWKLLSDDCLKYLSESSYFELSSVDKVRIQSYRMLAPFLEILGRR